MSLNIKNEQVHERVRRLAALTGQSQTAAVDDAVRRRLHEIEDDPLGRKGPQIRDALARVHAVFHVQGCGTPRVVEADLYDDETGLPR